LTIKNEETAQTDSLLIVLFSDRNQIQFSSSGRKYSATLLDFFRKNCLNNSATVND
jgi:3'-phosphoadenosine 5'-phosphosulfate sulfotransferase (PAPS reductase)/FAD synthetase